jgi:hypothetical protein
MGMSIMKINFRVECPHCKWGRSIQAGHINQGYLKGRCVHCDEIFYFKITVKGIEVDFCKELPEGVPCMTLAEAIGERDGNQE